MTSIQAGRIVMGAALAGLAGMALAGCRGRSESQRVPPPPTVTAVTTRKTNVPVIVYTQGTTRAINEVTIRARVQGFLKERHFTEGTDVKTGQLLFVIDEEPYQIKLDQAEANEAEAEASLRKAEHSKAPEVAEAQLHLDEAQFALDQVEEKRERSLLNRNAATIEDVERKQALLKKSAAQVEADRASLEQSRADYDTNILAAKASLEAAKASVRDARINLGYCRMYAPIDGRIGQALVKLGNLVGADKNTDLVTIQQLDPMGVDLNPPARRLKAITELFKKGLFADLSIEGERGYTHPSKVYFMDNTVEPTTGTFLMKASVPNSDEVILPGEYARVRANIGSYGDVIVVPEKAVMEGQAGATVYVVDQSHRVAPVRVKPIDVYRGMRVIESGLEPGQKVVVEGIQLIRAGQTVKVDEVPLDVYFNENDETGEEDKYESPVFHGRSSPDGAPDAAAAPKAEGRPPASPSEKDSPPRP
jgi:membrane fusion protein (multidrug efflux system)